MNELNEALNEIPSPLPYNLDTMPLPIAHLTSVEYYNNIVKEGCLKAKECNVFTPKKLIYFSYGNIFHRYGDEPTSSATWLPVSFLFQPDSINWIQYLFPYDTGAAYKYYNTPEVCNFERYKIINNSDQTLPLASKLVYYYFHSNRQYIHGNVDETLAREKLNSISSPTVLSALLQFLVNDLTKIGVDHRQRVIECQTENNIDLRSLLNNLIWIGLPKGQRDDFRLLCLRLNTSLPKIYGYDEMVSRSPDYYTNICEDKAREFMKGTYFNDID